MLVLDVLRAATAKLEVNVASSFEHLPRRSSSPSRGDESKLHRRAICTVQVHDGCGADLYSIVGKK